MFEKQIMFSNSPRIIGIRASSLKNVTSPFRLTFYFACSMFCNSFLKVGYFSHCRPILIRCPPYPLPSAAAPASQVRSMGALLTPGEEESDIIVAPGYSLPDCT